MKETTHASGSEKSKSLKKHTTDPMDYDGMGDFSRYRTAKNREFRSLENEIKDWLKSTISSITRLNDERHHNVQN